MSKIRTLGELRRSRHVPRSVRDELRDNVMARLRTGTRLFPGIVGYDETVVPQLANALLSRHDFILLGLRGQAKTRLLRGLVDLLDDEVPVVPGCPLNSHPYEPLSAHARRAVAEHGDALEIGWLPRAERYREKLATPDVTIADLLGDVDPIKAANRRLDLSHEEAIHFGIVPRTNRGIFGINELPDLPTRIQVGLLNVLEERDLQIRGFPLRVALDVMLVFTANPEDYTSRGAIITPLRDRIESQIHTHYPTSLADGMAITEQEAWQERGGAIAVDVPRWLREAVEEAAVQARTSSFVDQNSGVSARMTIALLENVISNAEQRAVTTGAARVVARVSDLFAALPAVAGKIELVYEGEREGPVAVARQLLGKAVKTVFDRVLPDPYEEHGGGKVYEEVLGFFRARNRVQLADGSDAAGHRAALERVPGLETLARNFLSGEAAGEARAAAMEFILEGLHQAALLTKDESPRTASYGDAFDAMVQELRGEEPEAGEEPGAGPRRPGRGGR